MIVFVTTTHHSYTHASVRAESEQDVRTITYGDLKARADSLPRATYVFTDVDRLPGHAALQAATYYRGLREHGQKVLNDPARMRSRFGLLRALNRAGINDFDAYRAEDLEQPRRWPVFLRFEGNHRKPVSELIHNSKQLEKEIERCLRKGLPLTSLLIIEYAAEPVRPGLYRKLSVFRLGETFLGYTCVHDDQWLVKIGKPAIAPAELYEEEYEFVANNPFADAMRPVFDIAGVEYGRVDFGLVGGRPQIYEINSNPDLQLTLEPSAIARRNESNALFRSNYLAALARIDTPGPAVTRSQKVTA